MSDDLSTQSWSADFRKPANAVSLLVGVIGILISVFTFLLTREEKEISYVVSEAPSLIYDGTVGSQRIGLVGPTGNRIQKSVFLAESVIWNSGNLPIEPSEVRRPLRLHVANVDQLLDFKIVTATDRDVSRFRIKPYAVPPGRTQGIELSWAHFDPGSAVKLQLIYAGEQPVRPRLGGSVVRGKIAQSDDTIDWWWFVAGLGGLVALLALVDYAFTRAFGNTHTSLKLTLAAIVVVPAVAYFLAYLCYLGLKPFIIMKPPIPL